MVEPVSYTHLDVYKRQGAQSLKMRLEGIHCGSFLIAAGRQQNPLLGMIPHGLVYTVESVHGHFYLGAEPEVIQGRSQYDPVRLHPVSYTHLDVYKRQSRRWVVQYGLSGTDPVSFFHFPAGPGNCLW